MIMRQCPRHPPRMHFDRATIMHGLGQRAPHREGPHAEPLEKREQEAEAIRKKMESDLNFEFIRRVQLKDYEGAREVVVEMIKILPPDSNGYGKAIEKKLELDRRIRAQRKR